LKTRAPKWRSSNPSVFRAVVPANGAAASLDNLLKLQRNGKVGFGFGKLAIERGSLPCVVD